jgi:hypothetical protein
VEALVLRLIVDLELRKAKDEHFPEVFRGGRVKKAKE